MRLVDFTLTQLSFTAELLVAAVAAFIGTVTFVYVGVRSFNQDAKEKGGNGKRLHARVGDSWSTDRVCGAIFYDLLRALLEGPLRALSSYTARASIKDEKGAADYHRRPRSSRGFLVSLAYAKNHVLWLAGRYAKNTLLPAVAR